MAQGQISNMSGFELGMPALVCRWRLSNRKLPLENRHLRALLSREVLSQPITSELVAWAKQHIEWTLDKGAEEHPNGVLMLIIDGEGRAAMTVGPYETLADTSLTGLTHRAARAADEAAKTRVAPETLWLAQGDRLLWGRTGDATLSGAGSLVSQLALTMGIEVKPIDGLVEEVSAGGRRFDEAFLVSDEHGIVPASDACGRHGTRMAEGYQRLLERA